MGLHVNSGNGGAKLCTTGELVEEGYKGYESEKTYSQGNI